MGETVLDVLMYLFENFSEEEQERQGGNQQETRFKLQPSPSTP